MDPLAELIALAGDLAALGDVELAQLLADLQTEGEALLEGAGDEEIALITQAAEAADAVRAEIDTRTQATEERATAAAAAIERIRAAQTTGPEEDENEPEADEVVTPVPEAIAAAATPPPRVPARARRPAAMSPRPSEAPGWSLVASANVPGITAGERLDTPERLGEAFRQAVEATRGYRGGVATKVPVAKALASYPEERTLDGNVTANMQKIRAVTSLPALVASGGVCAPSEVRYDVPVVGIDDRPVRDSMMTRFGADRGGVRTMPIPIITDMDAAVSIWTEANDRNPTNPTTKPCLTVTCPAEDETLVDAIVTCLQFGNFRARFWPEQIAAWTDLAAVQQAREAEVNLLTQIGAGSTAVTTGQIFGTARDVLAHLDRATSYLRGRHRLGASFPFRFGAPFWLRDNMRADLTREQPGSSTERLAMADAALAAMFAVRNVNVTWLLDGVAGQMFTTQGAGPLINWPTTAVTYLYPEGSWLFLDGGELNLGLVRDSTLNSTNNVRMFAETFEAAHFHGVESLKLTLDICPSGSSAMPDDQTPAICLSGS